MPCDILPGVPGTTCNRYVGLVVGEIGVGIVVWLAGGSGSGGVTGVVRGEIGGTGVGRAAVATGDGVAGVVNEGGTSVVTGSTGGTGMTMLTGGGEGGVGEIDGEDAGVIIVPEGVAFA